jgi:hypothetical protein
LAKATTTPDGNYVFTQVPALPEDKFYYVVFKNTSDPTRLGCWYTPDLAQFAAGETHTFAPFDIGNVALLSPAADALLPLPLTFTWTPRSYAPQDRYEFLLISEYHGSLKSDPALQLTDHYDLDAISAESFEPGMIHKWKINIYDSVNGGNGCGFEEREITFPRVLSGSGQINGQVREQGQPAAGVTLDLIFTAPDPYRGSHSGIMARTTTQADGSYSFTHIPELKGTSEYLSNYYVQFYNSDNPNRLRFWELRGIDDFYPGETYTFEPFDIANVELLAPAAGASAAFPLDFTWKARPYAPEDSYELYMEAPSFGYWSNYPPLRFIDHYQHYGLPPGSYRQFGIPVFWQIRIYDYIHGSSGYAFETREVTFLAPTHP